MPYQRKEDLPESVRSNLPSSAQAVYMSAFNAALEQYEGNEERAAKVAWSAVKNAGYAKNKEGKWTKAEDHAYAVTEVLAFDSSSDVRRTSEGYLLAFPRVARTGIQLYQGFELGMMDSKVIKIYRPDTEVFNNVSMRSFAHRPVTVEHPSELVDAANWKQYAVGYSGEDIVRDGEMIRVPLMLLDSKAIAEVEAGRSQLSAGYTMELDWTPGKTPQGEAYDAAQKSIRVNHIAITKAARGGPQLRIGDASWLGTTSEGEASSKLKQQGDSKMNTTTILIGDKRVTVEEEAAPVILRAMKDAADANGNSESRIKELEEELARLKAARGKEAEDSKAKDSKVAEQTTVIATKDAEIATLKQQLVDAAMTPQKLDLIVKERAEIITKAKAMVGDKLVTEGQTNTQIMRQVVDARVGPAAKEWADDAVRVSFDTLTVSAPVPDALAAALSRRKTSPSYSADSRESAHDARCKYLESAWKNPTGAASRQ